jgi:serine/threonine-protein kinase
MTSAGASETRPVSSPVPPLDAGAFAPGTILADRYRIVALAGRGGMGEVYRADDLRLGQPVALKFLPASLERDPAARERLAAEVRNARTIAHPNVCRVYDIGEVQGRSFLTMEYIDGEDLASLLRRIGRLPAAKALEIARQLCAGLAAAHDKGVLHRDLKPANVMIDGRGQARITDFGLAVEAGLSAPPADFAGTLAYMAPERFHGAPPTAQGDLYALGLILYETYTGKPAFKAATIGDWQRAHEDSTPSSPSALVSEIEPAVERAMLRCLEKDPARRPRSAAQVAASLPGGDPLAAAVAAGETPSPELVAASGAEGTLPRWQAWLWLAAVVTGFAALMSVISWWSLASRATLPHPELQKERAVQILRLAGYSEPASDSARWVRSNAAYLAHFRGAGDGGRALDAAVAGPWAVLYCYRRSPASLATFSGQVSADDPAPTMSGDAYLELGTDGRLVELRIVPSRRDAASPPAGTVDWSPLFAAAHLEPGRLTPVQPGWGPLHAYDTRAAWEGILENERVRVEAAARHGRATYFRVSPSWMDQTAGRDVAPPRASAFQQWFNVALILGSIAFVGVLAVRNLRLGRGDRRAAFRLAAFLSATFAVGNVLSRHWTAASAGTGAADTVVPGPGTVGPAQQVLATFGPALFLALAVWLTYIGFEPYARRRWPHLLIASTRLLEGRWRDPLVGRSLLAGVTGAVATTVLAALAVAAVRLTGPEVIVPGLVSGTLDGVIPFAGYVARHSSTYGWLAVIYPAMLLLARLALRRNAAAWAGLTLGCLAMNLAWGRAFFGPYPVVVAPFAIILTAGSVLMLSKSGLLTLMVWLAVLVVLRDTPWTSALTRWYAGPTWLSAATIAALALWGFRNVLGKQPAFPTD